MQVQQINPLSRTTNLYSLKKSTNCTTEYNYNNKNSIYAHNMSGLAFGRTATVKKCFEKEIEQQPEVLRKLFKKFFPTFESINLDLKISPSEMAKIKRIHVYASGSSKNAAEMAQDFIEKVTEVPVMVESASEFIHKSKKLDPEEDLALFISQSGGTADTFEALQRVKNLGVKTISITNNPDSKIALNSDAHISIDAGEEKAVAATKTVTSTIFSMLAAGMKMGEIKGTLDDLHKMHYIARFELIDKTVAEALRDTSDVVKAAKVLAQADNIYYYAKGSDVAAAKEGALKLTETTGKRVIADASGEALHGTFASIKPEDPVLQIIPCISEERVEKIALENINEIAKKRHSQNVIIMQPIYDSYSIESKEIPNVINIKIPFGGENVSPIITTVRFQQLTNEVTKILKIDPDNGGGFLTKFRQNISM